MFAAVKNWSAWGAYGACSVTCGGGEQKRYRTCKTTTIYGYGKDQDNCVGPTYSRRRCNTQCCPGTHPNLIPGNKVIFK